jgi:lipoprotein signal peptidase
LRWPTFNVADALIFVGAVILFLAQTRVRPPTTARSGASPAPSSPAA